MKCKYCLSGNVIKFGQVKSVQRYYCKDCGRKFVSTDTIPKMQTDTGTIANVLNMYYDGISETGICHKLIRQGDGHISTGTVYNWVRRFTDLAVRETGGYTLKVGRVWVADETALYLAGKDVCFWDVSDKNTHFLIASHMSLTRTTLDAQELMNQAYERTKVIPRVIYTDKLASYLVGVNPTFGEDFKHERGCLFDIKDNASLIEHFHAAFKDRSRIMHRLRNLGTIRRFMESWLLHYNYIRPNTFLAGRTPAEMAGVKLPFRDWKDFVEQPYTKTARIPVKFMAPRRLKK